MLLKLRPTLRTLIFCLLWPAFAEAETTLNLSARKEFLQQLEVSGPDWSPVLGITTVDPEIIPPEEKFVSPNQYFSVQLGLTGYEWNFAITDSESGATSHWPSAYSPLFSVGWTSDSRSIVAVAHAAHESLIELLHWDGHQWKSFVIDEPITADNCHIVSWEFKEGFLWVTAICDRKKKNKFSGFSFCRYVFRVDPATGHASNARETPLTRAQYCQLRTPQN